MKLEGKVCVVTGASSGIGRRIALDMAAEGARVCAVARRADRLDSLVKEMGGEAEGHGYVVTDVSDRAQVAALAKEVDARFGRCDVLVNNAGFNAPGNFDGPEAIDVVKDIMATNFFGAVYCTGELMALLRASAPSHIVNVTSIAGRIALGGAGAYSASKFALIGWSEALHQELYEHEVFVSSIEPGFIATEGFPQKDLVGDPVLRHALGSVEGVSRAVLNAIEHRKLQRVTPRWYYLLQLPKLLTPPIFRFTIRKVVTPRQKERLERGE